MKLGQLHFCGMLTVPEVRAFHFEAAQSSGSGTESSFWTKERTASVVRRAKSGSLLKSRRWRRSDDYLHLDILERLEGRKAGWEGTGITSCTGDPRGCDTSNSSTGRARNVVLSASLAQAKAVPHAGKCSK